MIGHDEYDTIREFNVDERTSKTTLGTRRDRLIIASISVLVSTFIRDSNQP